VVATADTEPVGKEAPMGAMRIVARTRRSKPLRIF
jgi:hypothetical protein